MASRSSGRLLDIEPMPGVGLFHHPVAVHAVACGSRRVDDEPEFFVETNPAIGRDAIRAICRQRVDRVLEADGAE
jgi:hypothetical protein